MRFRSDLLDLVALDRSDVLSVTLDIDPTKPENQAVHPAFQIVLRNSLRTVIDGLTKQQRRAVEDLGRRVLTHVEQNRPKGRGLALFAGPGLWREYLLPFPVPSRVRYGRPDLVPLLWALDEYDPYAILAVDREHARIVVAYLGTTTILSEDVLELDTSDWRFKAGRQPTFAKAAGVGATRGAERDTFAHRVEEQVRRFWQGAAEATAHWLRDLGIDRLIIGGPEEAASAVRDLLPQTARARVVGLVPLRPQADLPEIRERTLPVALEEEHRRERELVESILERAGDGRAVLGKGPTLDALQQERVMTLVVDRDVVGDVWQCVACRYVSAPPIDRCPTCGGEVEAVPLPQVLPLLARRSGARLELVGDDAARRLRSHDGVGGLLRYVA